MKKSYNYYENQLDRVEVDNNFSPILKIVGEHDETKWLNINKESKQYIIKWLNKNFP